MYGMWWKDEDSFEDYMPSPPQRWPFKKKVANKNKSRTAGSTTQLFARKKRGSARAGASSAGQSRTTIAVLPRTATATATLRDNNDDDDTHDGEVLFGSIRGQVVGLQYYTGVVNNNEMVSLERQPQNQYDRNAVKVSNVLGAQVGHLKKELACPLAFIMDQRLARVEGVVPFGAQNTYSMPVDLIFWGQAERRADTIAKLKQFGYFMLEGMTEPGDAGRRGMSSSQPKRIFLNPSDMKSEVDKLFEGLDEADKTSEANACEAVHTALFSHQRQALSWMMMMENSQRLPPFWEERPGPLYYNTITVSTTRTRPKSVCGGILADDMGLGKTLTIISLILTNFQSDGLPLITPVTGYIRPSKKAKLKRLESYREKIDKKLLLSQVTDLPTCPAVSLDMDRALSLCRASDRQDVNVMSFKDTTAQPSKKKSDRVQKVSTGASFTISSVSEQSAVTTKSFASNFLSNALDKASKVKLSGSSDKDSSTSVDNVTSSSDKTSPDISSVPAITEAVTDEQIPSCSNECIEVVSDDLNTAVHIDLINEVVSLPDVPAKDQLECDGNKNEFISVSVEKTVNEFLSNVKASKRGRKAKQFVTAADASFNVVGRPRRTIKKPAMYRDDSEREVEEAEEKTVVPAKKTKTKRGQQDELTSAAKESCDVTNETTQSNISNNLSTDPVIFETITTFGQEKHLPPHKSKLTGHLESASKAGLASQTSRVDQMVSVEDAVPDVGEDCVVTSSCIVTQTLMDTVTRQCDTVEDDDLPDIVPVNKLSTMRVAAFATGKGRGHGRKQASNKSRSSSGMKTTDCFIVTEDKPSTCTGRLQHPVSNNDIEVEGEFDLPDLSLLDMPDIGSSKTKFGKSTGRTKGKGPRATLIICPLSTLETG